MMSLFILIEWHISKQILNFEKWQNDLVFCEATNIFCLTQIATTNNKEQIEQMCLHQPPKQAMISLQEMAATQKNKYCYFDTCCRFLGLIL